MNRQSVAIELPNEQATRQLGETLGRHLPAGTVLLLSGNLGSGKTTLIQGLGLGLGITDPISSPTFTLVNEYLEGRVPLYHVDLYRLDAAEVDSLYLDTYWDEQETAPGIVAIEWAERLQRPPVGAIALSLAPSGDGRRAHLETADPAHIPLLEQILRDGLLVDEI